jgi:hypothetical protein
MKTLRFKIGDKAIVRDNLSSHGFNIGEEVVIVDVQERDYPDDCDYAAEELNGSDYWYLKDEELAPLKESPTPQGLPLLTKREYFAAMAMQGILSQLKSDDIQLSAMQYEYFAKTYPGATMFQAVGRESVGMADALIDELNKDQ